MVYVTHDQVEAMTLATRIVVMQAGAIQQIGTPEEVYERPANRFVAGFLGSPSMNFLEGTAAELGKFVRVPDGPGEVALGVRPEHVQLDPAGPLEGQVVLVEPMGNHEVVWIECGRYTLSCISTAASKTVAGTTVRFSIDAARASMFDLHSGQRLQYP
jgi:multiple sugar transport system ATP-binding protein